MAKRKKGVTLVEVVITLAIIGIVMSVIFAMFNSSQRTLIDTELKSNLQYETQRVQEKIASIGVQSSGITELTPIGEATSKGKYKVTTKVSNITLKNYSDESIDENYKEKEKYTENSFVLESDGTLKLVKQEVEVYLEKSENSNTNDKDNKKEQVICKGVEYLEVSYDTDDYKDAQAIEIKVKLKDEKGLSKKDLTTSTIITFRNFGL